MDSKHASLLLSLLALVSLPPSTGENDSPTPAAPHCQVPCGIYGDKMRIDMLMEDAATIEKAMAQVREMESADRPDYNQIVRWITTKDDHAQHLQDMAADYWLAQRIKKPESSAGSAAQEKYLGQLQHMHGILVAAMKCKQTTAATHVGELRVHALAFSETYFSAADLKHVKEHHGDK